MVDWLHRRGGGGEGAGEGAGEGGLGGAGGTSGDNYVLSIT